MSYIDIRGASIARSIGALIGNRVYSGPFKGMELALDRHDGNFSPYLLGTYEHELHHIIPEIVTSGYRTILNVGCSFGYYAVGLARLMPETTIHARDISEDMLDMCRHTCMINKVKNVYHSTSINMVPLDEGLIIMDCEGAEEEYLDPSANDFSTSDILVEIHECNKPGLTNKILARFEKTHRIELIYNKPDYFDLTRIFGDEVEFEHFDNAIATFEGRAGATPWAWMVAK